MKRKIMTGFLALVLVLQAFIPSFAYALEEKPKDSKLITKKLESSDSSFITIGKLKGVGFSKDNPTASISAEEVKEKNHKNTDDLDGLEISDEIVPQALRSTKSPYITGQQPADPDKPKYWANVQGKLTTVGIDGTTFDWNKVLGQGAKVKLLFTQTNGNVMTGVTYTLLVDKDGTYTWQGSDGKPTYLPLYDVDGNPYTYNVQIQRNFSENVQLIIQEINGTPGVSWRPEGDKQVATISFLNIKIQQLASTKFVSEWHTSLEESNRPQIEGYFKVDDETDNTFNFPKNDTSRTILRYSFLENFVEDEDNGPWAFISDELETTPETVEVKTDTQGLTFEEADGVKTVKSGDHKFKYDFKYDVINGGKLTMTEVIPVTFDANGGNFASITDPNADQKIVKEVDYEKDLTGEVEKPKKDLETFKGWSETKGGTTPVTDDAFKNIKEAKTFYAIWDNNDILAEELEVKESFKDGDAWVNNFIPTLDQLKAQVKIKDADGEPKALANGDTFAIVDGTNEYTADGDALKNYLYEKLKEKDDVNKPSRTETVKAKITHADGTSQTVDIPIKVIKNIYEAKTLTDKPFYVPSDYVKVTLDPTTKAQDPQKTYYYVNPEAKVVIPGTDPTGTDGNVFTKWTMKADTAIGDGADYNLSARHQFKEASTITAQYSKDVIPQEGNTKPEGVPDNFVKVTFVPTDKGTMEGAKIFWVNPAVEVTIPVNNPVGKTYYTFKEWKMGENADGAIYNPSTPTKFTDTNGTTITATYKESDNIIPYDPSVPDPMVRPKGYVRVTFAADPGLKLTEQKAYYVKANANIALKDIKDDAAKGYPTYEEETGYKFKEWDKPDTTEIGATDIVVTAKATPLDDVVPKDNPQGGENDKPAGYISVTFKTTDKAGNVEKVVYINPTKAVALEGQAPEVNPITGYEFADWDRPIKEKIQYKDNDVITAQFNKIGDVVPGDKAQPAGYIKVIFDKGEHGELSGTTSYWVKPEVEVTVEAPSVKANTGYKFTKWDKETTLTAKTTDKEIKITAEYEKLEDIIPSTDENEKPNTKPEGYVTVTFEKGDHGTLSGQNVYYVNPEADPVKTLANITKPIVKAEVGYKFTSWNFADTKEIRSDITVIAQYNSIEDIVPKDKPTGGENDKPEGYITVTFKKGAHGELEGNTVFYVNPNKAVVLEDKAPTIKPNTGYTSAGWDTSINKAIQYKDGDKITALYNELGDVIPQEKTDGSDKPAGYLTVTFDKGANGELEGKTVYYVKPNVEVTVPAPSVTPAVGYDFDKWDKALTQIFTEDTTITAGYKPLDDIIPQEKTDGTDKPEGYHKVTFEAVNGTLSGQTVYYVKPDVDIDLTDTANNITKKADVGYTAEGGTWTPAISEQKYTKDETYTFTFKALDDVVPKDNPQGGENTKPDGYVIVEFIADANGSIVGGNKTYYVNPTKGIKVGSTELPIPETKPAENYKFDNWYEAIDKTEPIKNDKKFVARFKLNKVTMTYKADDATTGTVPEALSYDIGTEITIAGGNDLKKDNAVLTGWKIGGKTYKPGEKYTINDNTTATAIWEAGLHTVNFDTVGGTHIDSQQVKHEELITPVGNPEKDGYFFVGWKIKGTDKVFDPTKDKVTEDITLVAQYSKDIIPQTGDNKPEGVPDSFVLVEFKEGTNGTLTGTTKYWVNLTAGKKLSDIVHPSVTANEGWKHTGWDKTEDTEINTELEVTAKYLKKVLTEQPTENAEKYVKVEFKQGEHGTIDANATSTYWVLKDEAVTLTPPAVNPNTGYAQKTGDGAWSPKVETSYSRDTEHVAQYDYNGKDVIPQPGSEKPDNVPKNFVLVEFKPGDHGSIASTETVKYWVNPTKLVTLTPPTVTPNAGYEQEKGLGAWDRYLRDMFTEDTVITAQYRKLEEPCPPTPDKPDDPYYPERPDYPYYPERPYYPLRPEVRYETIIQEKVVKVPIIDNAYFKEVRYMQGFNGDFRPKDGLTRAEAAQILANALVEDGYKYNKDFKLSYKDIGEAWYTRAVKIVTEANVFEGYDDGNFKPQDKITRNEWIATLKRFQELGDASGNHMNLRDGHWAMSEIEAAYNEGWLKIYSDGLATYEGDKFIPREEVAAVSNKAFNRVLDKTYIINNDKNLITYKDVKKDMWSYEDILCASNTFLYKKDLYRAHWIKEDNNQFNINTDGFEIVKAKFQRNPR